MITWNRSECFKVTWRIYWKSTINEQYSVLLAIIGDFDHWHENLFKIEKFNTFVAQLIRQTPFVFKCVSFWSTNSRAVKFKNGIWWALKKQTKLLFLSLKINLKLKSMLKSSKSPHKLETLEKVERGKCFFPFLPKLAEIVLKTLEEFLVVSSITKDSFSIAIKFYAAMSIFYHDFQPVFGKKWS